MEDKHKRPGEHRPRSKRDYRDAQPRRNADAPRRPPKGAPPAPKPPSEADLTKDLKKDILSMLTDNDKEKSKEEIEPEALEIRLKFSLIARDQVYLKNTFPSFKFTWDKGANPHTHPILAIERMLGEEKLLSFIKEQGRIVDIGGNPARHASKKRNSIWCCNPILDGTDAVRSAMHRTYKDSCQHKAEDCTCVIAPLAHIAVHSIYYLEPETINELVNSSALGQLYSLHHQFPHVRGNFASGEADYEVHRDLVTMRTRGGLAPYKHKNNKWMYTKNTFKSFDRNGKLIAMAWDKLFEMGNSDGFLFVKLDPVLVTKDDFDAPPDLLRSLTLKNYLGPIDKRCTFSRDPIVTSHLKTFQIPDADIYSAGEYIYFTEKDKDREMIIPKEAVAKLSAFVAGKVRDPHLFQVLVSQARTELAKHDLTPDEISESVMPVAALAFTKDLNKEATIMASSLWRNKHVISVLNKLLKFEAVDVLSKWYKIIGSSVLALGIALGLLYRYGTKLSQTPLNKGSVWSIIQYYFGKFLHKVHIKWRLPPWIHACYTAVVQQATRKVTRAYVGPTAGLKTKIHHHEPLHFPDVCNVDRPLVELHEEAEIYAPHFEKCEEKFGCVQFGPAVITRRPVVSRTCNHNELVAVNNRGCMATPPASKPFWILIVNPTLEAIIPINRNGPYMETGKLRPPPFMEWVQRFPPPKRAILIQYYQLMKSGQIDVIIQNETFIKKEHVMKWFPDCLMLYDPRLIQGRHPSYQITTGPTTYAFTKYLAWLWNVDCLPDSTADLLGRPRSNVVYTSGYTAEALGQLLQSQLDRLQALGRVVLSESDFVRMDAHFKLIAVAIKNAQYDRLGCTKRFRKWIKKQADTVGTTTNGVKYKVPGTVKSGDGDTSSGDAEVNGVLIVIIFMIVSTLNWFSMVLGDDSAVILLEQDVAKVRKRMDLVYKLSGFVVETIFMTSPYDLEYLSGRFWPTNHGLVFGPKIGRVLAKTYHSKKDYALNKGLAWVRAVALGLRLDVNFIPILRVVNRRVIELTEGVKPMTIPIEVKPHAEGEHEAITETFLMMEHLYGLGSGAILACEDFIRENMKSPICTIDHPVITTIVEHDLPEVDLPRKSQLKFGSSLHHIINTALNQLTSDFHLTSHFLLGIARSLTGEEWMAITLAPIAEELAKRLPFVGELICGFELLKCYEEYNSFFQALITYMPTLTMHEIAQESPIKRAIVIHITFNVYVACANLLQRRGRGDIAGLMYAFVRWLSIFYQVRQCRALWNKYMHSTNGNTNSVGALQEMLVKYGITQPIYHYEASGASHMPTFTCTAVIEHKEKTITGHGTGFTKAQAKQVAAAQLLAMAGEIQNQIPPSEPITLPPIGSLSFNSAEVTTQTNEKSTDVNPHVAKIAKEFTVMMRAVRETTFWDLVLVDADQFHPKKEYVLKYPIPVVGGEGLLVPGKIRATKLLLYGNSHNIHSWKTDINWKRFFELPDETNSAKWAADSISFEIVPATKDAADLMIEQTLIAEILSHLSSISGRFDKYPPYSALIITGDKGIMKRTQVNLNKVSLLGGKRIGVKHCLIADGRTAPITTQAYLALTTKHKEDDVLMTNVSITFVDPSEVGHAVTCHPSILATPILRQMVLLSESYRTALAAFGRFTAAMPSNL